MATRWTLTPAEARGRQLMLRDRVVTTDDHGPLRSVAGVDVGFGPDDQACAAISVASYPGLRVLEEHAQSTATPFPYVPGLFSFRELPPLLEVWARLDVQPDVVICDGHGVAHPRRFGLASHLGVHLDVPTIGCAKTLLCGEFADLGEARGDRAPLVFQGEVVGMALRTRDRVKPVFVSVGHRVSLETACEVVLACARRRITEPIRWADQLSKQTRAPGDPPIS
ncbi:MAG: deoxyribonuclease V [Planctomycetes bacterium]|nr:deoxyribonuclease V [Planctomycetota bacterium]